MTEVAQQPELVEVTRREADVQPNASPSSLSLLDMVRMIRKPMRERFADRQTVRYGTVSRMRDERFIESMDVWMPELVLWVAGTADETVFESLCTILELCDRRLCTLSTSAARKLNLALANRTDDTMWRLNVFAESARIANWDSRNAQRFQKALDYFIESLNKNPSLANFAKEHSLEYTTFDEFLDRIAEEDEAALKEIKQFYEWPDNEPLPDWRADDEFCEEGSILKKAPPFALRSGKLTFRQLAKRLICRYVERPIDEKSSVKRRSQTYGTVASDDAEC